MAILDDLQLSNQVEKLAQVSRDLRRKHKQIQNQMRLVCEERSELTAIVQSQQRDIAALQQDSAQNKKCPTCGVATPEGAEDDDQSAKPTFSVRELRAILHERNELKLKLSRAEEQLHALQADQHHDSGSDTSPSVSTGAAEEEEAPVQGPLPAEPDDAPWKRNSGIRKFIVRPGKLDELKCIVQSFRSTIHIIILTETWIKSVDEAKRLQIPGYTHYCNYRNGSRGGGVSIFAHDNLKHHLIEEMSINDNHYIWIHLEKYSLDIAGIYRKPDASNMKGFLETYTKQLHKRKRAIVFGDFNINLLNLDQTTINYKEELQTSGHRLLNKIEENYCTRETSKTKTIIDHVSTNLKDTNFHLAVIASAMTDHNQLYLEIKKYQPEPPRKVKYEAINYEKLYSTVEEWKNTNENNLYQLLEEKLLSSINSSKITKTKVLNPPRQDWIKKTIINLINKRNILCSGWRCRRGRRSGPRRRRESLSALGIEDVCAGVFASSLLSLISPWAPSSVARRAPPPPPAPRPPPHPRRHSHPHAPPTQTRPPAPRRRYSEHPPTSKLDLRQELLDLNLGTQEFDTWLGNKFEENEEFETGPYDPRFVHDIPLQRSISLDRGIDIFNHLQAIGSETTSVSSLWTVDSDGRDSFTDRYRSFEDIPTSPYRARSRSASFGVETFSERDLALAVLNESYKGLEAPSGSVSPQIRKLQRCFTFAGSFDSIKDRGPVEHVSEKVKPKLRLMIPNRRNSNSCPVSPDISRLRSFFPNTAASDTTMSDDEDQVFEVQEPVYRSISFEWSQEEEARVKQRRSGLHTVMTDLRKTVLVKQGFKSCENLENNRGSSELDKTFKHLKSNSNPAKLSRTASFSGNTDSVTVPTIIISPADSAGVANISNTSNYVEISRNCDCRICKEGDGRYFLRSALSKLFVKIVSCKSRKLYWDENNNLNDSEMYKCVMHVLKLMLGLWLRHLDHN
uniref:RH2 domain-containing protein n=1 Tax=Heliothis virescens TaxID=7102 RepID=A0A2A4JSM7_HELVI